MLKANLPIKVFEKRSDDLKRVEGGGSKILPKFVLSPDELGEKSRFLVEKSIEIQSEVLKRKQKNSEIPVVFTALLNDKAQAKSHRKEVRKFFEIAGQNNLLAPIDKNKLIVKVEDIKTSRTFIKKFRNTENNYALSAIDDICLFYPFLVEQNKSKPLDYKVRLIDFENPNKNEYINKLFINFFKQQGFDIKELKYTDNYTLYKFSNVQLDSILSYKNENIFDSIYSIQPMPKYYFQLDSLQEADETIIFEPKNNENYGIVGILDTGIESIPQLKPWLEKEYYTSYPNYYKNKFHGTFVASVAVYGDKLQKKKWVNDKGVKILDACIFPDETKETIDEDELIYNIRDSIKQHCKNVKIWNLSVSSVEKVDEFKFSDFAVALDDIQDKYDVLICKSVGNCSNFKTNLPNGKICKGADSVRALSVGSITHKSSNHKLFEIDSPSSFTCFGRGPSYIIKPEVVH